MAVAVHGGRIDDQDDRLAVARCRPCAPWRRRPTGGRDGGPSAQAGREDGGDDCPAAGAVIEDGGGGDRFQLQIDLGTVALVGPDARPGLVEGERCLSLLGHDLVQFVAGDGEAVRAQAASRSSTANPAARLAASAPGLRLVPQVLAQNLLTLTSRFSSMTFR